MCGLGTDGLGERRGGGGREEADDGERGAPSHEPPGDYREEVGAEEKALGARGDVSTN